MDNAVHVIPVLMPIYKPDHRGLGMVIDSLVAQKKSIKFDMALYFIVDDLTSDIDHLLEPLRVFNVPYFVENNPVNKGQWSIYNNFSLNCGSKWFFILHQDDIVRDDWFLILTTELDNANPEKCATISSEWDRLPITFLKKILVLFQPKIVILNLMFLKPIGLTTYLSPGVGGICPGP